MDRGSTVKFLIKVALNPQNLDASRLVLQLSLSDALEPGASKMKM